MIDPTLRSHFLTTDDNILGKIQIHNVLAIHLMSECYFLGPSVYTFKLNQDEHSICTKFFLG